MKVAVVIPTLNEEDAIGELLDRIPEVEGYEITPFIVDGLSTDRTVEIARERGAEVIVVEKPGKGEAIKGAVEKLPEEYRRVIMMDGDLTYRPKYIPSFLEELEEHDVVYGSRNMIKNGMDMPHIIGNKLGTLTASLLFERTTDLCTGYVGFRREVLDSLEIEAGGFDLEVDMFAKACKKGFDIEEIDIDYFQREGQSKFNPLLDPFKILKRLLVEKLAE